jgi:hypothetical protein
MPTVHSYTDPEYFLRNAPSADITITSRSSRAQEMTALEAMEVSAQAPRANAVIPSWSIYGVFLSLTPIQPLMLDLPQIWSLKSLNDPTIIPLRQPPSPSCPVLTPCALLFNPTSSATNGSNTTQQARLCCAQQTGMHIGCGSTAYSVGTVYGGKGRLHTPGVRPDLLATPCLASLAITLSLHWRSHCSLCR